ncbi:MAG: oligosaccharide flippase family protein, partial [Armatimonadota bacterium]|nr:oligosaccharide flippase family protein [Armatimonadota bacterium]
MKGNLEPREISSLMKHMFVYGGGILLGKATGFIMIPIYTRALTRADYGVLELLTRSAEVASIVLALGMSSAVLRFYFDHDDQRDRDLLVSSAFAFSVLLAVGATALLSVFAGKL